jgi:hypothetical protein
MEQVFDAGDHGPHRMIGTLVGQPQTHFTPPYSPCRTSDFDEKSPTGQSKFYPACHPSSNELPESVRRSKYAEPLWITRIGTRAPLPARYSTGSARGVHIPAPKKAALLALQCDWYHSAVQHAGISEDIEQPHSELGDVRNDCGQQGQPNWSSPAETGIFLSPRPV